MYPLVCAYIHVAALVEIQFFLYSYLLVGIFIIFGKQIYPFIFSMFCGLHCFLDEWALEVQQGFSEAGYRVFSTLLVGL